MPLDRLKGKVAIITGAGQGIGRGIALAFAKEGATVVLAGRTYDKVRAVEDELAALGLSAHAIACDVARQDDVEAMVAQAADKFGRIDVLVNNAGAAFEPFLPLDATPNEFFQMGVDINLYGTLWCMQAALPHLKESRGFIINVASAAGTNGAAYLGTYAATKEGVRALTRTAAKEWGPFGINVNVICPFARTAAWQGFEDSQPEMCEKIVAEIPMGYVGDPETDIGPVALFLATEGSRYVTGHTIMVDGGQTVLR
ncbi:SDR family NAD(P)-dependent oxidoreductase [Novosphingobium malaysiense]|uniref:Ketoreductase domain-containing protein n=1 Tax=Novosphingobium malaysiense TaxID=1348853 RepID=A0A0B1ZIA1_9SPHN|nr:SDR family NAD(P)-dependent oxidoreductase [Novosphingobium malaysiense]KHK89052.1 hypothetical protein LK12_22100 [Novosphingobium malaysiense]